MITCSKCEVTNSVDSLFCKGCGAGLSGDALIEAKTRLEELTADGFRVFNEGRVGEAKLIADSVIAELPNDVTALSLKGLCLEREDDLPGALEVYEKIVDLNPESSLDRIKVQHLRQSITAKATAVPEQSRSAGMVAGIAAFVLVAAAGGAIAMSMNNKGTPVDPNTQSASNTIHKPLAMNTTKDENESANPNMKVVDPGNSNSDVPDGNRVQPIKNSENSNSESTDRPTRMGGAVTASNDVTAIPNPNEAPVTFQGPINITPTNNNSGGNSSGTVASNSSRPQNPPKNPTEDVQPKVDTDNPGYVEIKIANANGGSNTGGVRNPPPKGPGAVIQNANQQYMLGKFDQAAKLYLEAINQGAGSASVYQRLAQCYENLGKKSDAANAYRQAISILETRVENGGSQRDKSTLEACREALKLLGA